MTQLRRLLGTVAAAGGGPPVKKQVVGSNGATPLVQSITTTAGSLIVVAVRTSASTLPVLSDSAGQTYSAAVTSTSSAGNVGGIYYFPNSAALTSITATQAGATLSMTVIEYSGMALSSPVDQTGSHTLSFSNYTVTASGANGHGADAVVVADFHTYNAPTTSDGTYTTETDQQPRTFTASLRVFDKIISATETSSMAITVTGYGETSVIATFKGG